MRTLEQLLNDQSNAGHTPINGLFKRQDDRIKELEAQLATALKTVRFQNDVIEKLRQSHSL